MWIAWVLFLMKKNVIPAIEKNKALREINIKLEQRVSIKAANSES